MSFLEEVTFQEGGESSSPKFWKRGEVNISGGADTLEGTMQSVQKFWIFGPNLTPIKPLKMAKLK